MRLRTVCTGKEDSEEYLDRPKATCLDRALGSSRTPLPTAAGHPALTLSPPVPKHPCTRRSEHPRTRLQADCRPRHRLLSTSEPLSNINFEASSTELRLLPLAPEHGSNDTQKGVFVCSCRCKRRSCVVVAQQLKGASWRIYTGVASEAT